MAPRQQHRTSSAYEAMLAQARGSAMKSGLAQPKKFTDGRRQSTAVSNDDSDESHEESSDGEALESSDDDSDDDTPTDVSALSGAYPFEFDTDDRLTGTSDDEDHDSGAEISGTSKNMAGGTPIAARMNSRFEDSMDMADVDSDADDYAAVGAISDDDDDEDDEDAQDDDCEDQVLRAAELDLIAEFHETEDTRVSDLTNAHESLASADMDQLDRGRSFSLGETDDDPFSISASVNMNADPWQGASFMDENWGSLWGDAEMGLWRKPTNTRDSPVIPQNPKQKRVRFQVSNVRPQTSSDSSSGSSDEDEDVEHFPDIFVDQADPKIQQILARDSEVEWNGFGADAGDAESVYDFEDDADRFAFRMDEDSNSSDADGSSESDDDGDDTEDESIEEQQAKMQQFRKAMRLAASTSAPSTPNAKTSTPGSAKSTPGSRRLMTPRLARGPRQGTFACDPTKAILTTDKSTRKTILYPPTQPSPHQKAFWERARSATNNRDGSPRGAIAIPQPVRDTSPERPFTAKATLSSMFDGRIDFLDDSDLPPAETPQPFPSFNPPMSSFTTATDDGSDMEAEYPAAFDTLLNMENFEDDSSDTDMATSGGIDAMEPAFLSQGVVGSFRLNQHRARHESSLPSHPAKRASTAEHNALQNGRRAAGNAPITPARKRRTSSQDLHRTGSGVKKPATPAFSSPIVARRRHSRGQSLSGRLDQTLTPEMWKKA